MTVEQIKQTITGEWISIAPEIRPSISKNADGSLKPFYLTRAFKYLAHDKFELTITNFADAYGKVPMAKLLIKGNMVWPGEHPIAAGAQKVNLLLMKLMRLRPCTKGLLTF